jgi:hypothetical protein
VNDLDLVAWFPLLTRKDEASVKKKWKAFRIYKSEWFPETLLSDILAYLETLDKDMKDCCDLQLALATRRRL